MPFLAYDLDALNKAPNIARAGGITEDAAIAGLARLWAHCFRDGVDRVSAGQVVGFFGGDGVRVAMALVDFGFLEEWEGGWRVRGAERYLRIRKGRSEGGKKASGNLKRGPLNPRLKPGGSRGGAGSAARLVPGLSPNTEHRAPIIKEEREAPPLLEVQVADPVDELRDAWNGRVQDPIPTWRSTSARRRKLALKALERRPLEEWRVVFERIGNSHFCRGNNERGWKADPDWALRDEGAKAETAARVLEGAYDGPPPVAPSDRDVGRTRKERGDCAVCGPSLQVFESWGCKLCTLCMGAWMAEKVEPNEAATAAWVAARKERAA